LSQSYHLINIIIQKKMSEQTAHEKSGASSDSNLTTSLPRMDASNSCLQFRSTPNANGCVSSPAAKSCIRNNHSCSRIQKQTMQLFSPVTNAFIPESELLPHDEWLTADDWLLEYMDADAASERTSISTATSTSGSFVDLAFHTAMSTTDYEPAFLIEKSSKEHATTCLNEPMCEKLPQKHRVLDVVSAPYIGLSPQLELALDNKKASRETRSSAEDINPKSTKRQRVESAVLDEPKATLQNDPFDPSWKKDIGGLQAADDDCEKPSEHPGSFRKPATHSMLDGCPTVLPDLIKPFEEGQRVDACKSSADTVFEHVVVGMPIATASVLAAHPETAVDISNLEATIEPTGTGSKAKKQCRQCILKGSTTQEQSANLAARPTLANCKTENCKTGTSDDKCTKQIQGAAGTEMAGENIVKLCNKMGKETTTEIVTTEQGFAYRDDLSTRYARSSQKDPARSSPSKAAAAATLIQNHSVEQGHDKTPKEVEIVWPPPNALEESSAATHCSLAMPYATSSLVNCHEPPGSPASIASSVVNALADLANCHEPPGSTASIASAVVNALAGALADLANCHEPPDSPASIASSVVDSADWHEPPDSPASIASSVVNALANLINCHEPPHLKDAALHALFQAQPLKWQIMYTGLIKFQRVNGHSKISRTYMHAGFNVEAWLRHQRKCCRDLCAAFKRARICGLRD
jgi:hypothetical protein